MVAFSGNDDRCYQLCLAPDSTGRWQQVGLHITGEWWQ